jgi:hypothetical protein
MGNPRKPAHADIVTPMMYAPPAARWMADVILPRDEILLGSSINEPGTR